jgi:hypothetical protein
LLLCYLVLEHIALHINWNLQPNWFEAIAEAKYSIQGELSFNFFINLAWGIKKGRNNYIFKGVRPRAGWRASGSWYAPS